VQYRSIRVATIATSLGKEKIGEKKKNKEKNRYQPKFENSNFQQKKKTMARSNFQRDVLSVCKI
jgi:hypothetical protein